MSFTDRGRPRRTVNLRDKTSSTATDFEKIEANAFAAELRRQLDAPAKQQRGA